MVVSNSSPLIAFISIDRMELLERLFGTVVIPPTVYEEVFRSHSGRTISTPKFIQVEAISSDTSARFLKMSLHDGESEAIVLALEKGIGRIILDDKQARETASRMDIHVMGTLGVLMLAKEKGYIDEVRPLIIQMIDRISFRIAPAVLNRALARLKEPPL